MKLRLVLWLLGTVVLVIGISMALPLFWASGAQEADARRAILLSMGACLAIGLALVVIGRGASIHDLERREGLGVVALGWLVASVLGALPYLLSGTLHHPVDALFESVSGFTTTGSSVIDDVESVPHAILFWRSYTNWLGGIGIIVLFIAIVPQIGAGGRHLFRSEIPGVSKEGLSPRVKDTAVYLLTSYAVLTLVEVACLIFAGMNLFDAICHSFATIATGGFSTRNASIAAFDSPVVDTIIIVFMVLAGTNFALYFAMLRGPRRGAILRDPEWRTYISLLFIAMVVISVDLIVEGIDPDFPHAMRSAAFTVTSILTTTGFATANFDAWSSFDKAILLGLMLIGGSAGSTAGGMKIIRVLVLLRYCRHSIYRWFRPSAVLVTRIGGTTVKNYVVETVVGFFVLTMAVFGIASVFMSLCGLDLVTATSSVMATLFNIGPGLEAVGATHTYSSVPMAGKLVLSGCMLLGRLELFTIMVLFVPAFWRR